MAELPEDLHFQELTAIYGTSVAGDEESQAEFRNQGAVIATLYWKLAEARGLVGKKVAS
jgi:hypothetical protein